MPIGGRFRGVIVLVLSLFVAALLTRMLYNVIQDARESVVVAKPKPRKEVVVAAVDIPPGWTIKQEHLRNRQLPENYIPDEVYRSPGEIVGRVAMERILAGEFVREERLADPEAGQGLPAIIPRGMRALQVPVKDSSAVSGFLNPGNFVDVIAVCAKAEPPEVRTLLQSVTVLGVNDRMTSLQYAEQQSSAARRRIQPSVTLALRPSEAELVKHAFGACRITLTLRNDIDVTNIETNARDASAGPDAPPSADPTLDPMGPRGALAPNNHDSRPAHVPAATAGHRG